MGTLGTCCCGDSGGCPPGMHRDPITGQCVPDITLPPIPGRYSSTVWKSGFPGFSAASPRSRTWNDILARPIFEGAYRFNNIWVRAGDTAQNPGGRAGFLRGSHFLPDPSGRHYSILEDDGLRTLLPPVGSWKAFAAPFGPYYATPPDHVVPGDPINGGAIVTTGAILSLQALAEDRDYVGLQTIHSNFGSVVPFDESFDLVVPEVAGYARQINAMPARYRKMTERTEIVGDAELGDHTWEREWTFQWHGAPYPYMRVTVTGFSGFEGMTEDQKARLHPYIYPSRPGTPTSETITATRWVSTFGSVTQTVEVSGPITDAEVLAKLTEGLGLLAGWVSPTPGYADIRPQSDGIFWQRDRPYTAYNPPTTPLYFTDGVDSYASAGIVVV